MTNQGRHILAVALAVAWLTTVAYPNDSTADKKKELTGPTELIPFELGKPIPVSVTANTRAVTSYKLFRLREIEFQLDKKSHLSAKIAILYTTGLTNLPTVTYVVHAAVFDANGKLLGTANTSRRIATWSTVGAVGRCGSEVTVDFGSSLNYNKAKYFTLVISHPEIQVANESGKDATPSKRQ